MKKKLRNFLKAFFIIAFVKSLGFSYHFGHTEIVHSSNFVDFIFPSEQERNSYINNEHYRNVSANGIKIDSQGNIYCTFPRWKENCPVTLGKFNTEKKKFEAFPSWEINSGDSSEVILESILGIEIDTNDNLYILDQGIKEAPKLVIWDLQTNKLLRIKRFSNREAPIKSSFLNDLVVNDKKIYIADSGIGEKQGNKEISPAIIFLDLETNVCKRLLISHKSTLPDMSLRFSVNGKKCLKDAPMITGADGIALSCDFKRLYFTPLTSRMVYAIDTEILEKGTYSQVNSSVVMIGDKSSTSDGLLIGNKKTFFITALETNQILYTKESKTKEIFNQKLSVYNKDIPVIKLTKLLPEDMESVWTDTLSLGNDGFLYSTSNDLCGWLDGDMDYEKENYFIRKTYVDEKSYVHGCPDYGNETLVALIILCILFALLGVAAIFIIACQIIFWGIKNHKEQASASHYAKMEGNIVVDI